MRAGFTLIEVLIVIAVIAVIAAVSVLNLAGRRTGAVLTDPAKQMGALPREAQGDALAGEQGAEWGVHFDNTTSTAQFYSLFYTSNGTYASSTEFGQYPLPAGLCFATSSVPDASTSDVIFSTASGAPLASATITLQSMANGGCASTSSAIVIATATITVGPTGAVTY